MGTEVVKVLQLNIFAFNAAGQPIVNFFALAFSNNCDEFPSLIQGESAGWTQFTTLDPPIDGSCPAASLPTSTPAVTEAPAAAVDPVTPVETTPAPTALVTEAPTADNSTDVPSSSPTATATDEPTVDDSTDAPSSSPTATAT